MSHTITNRMKALDLGYSEKMLFALLRASLHQQEVGICLLRIIKVKQLQL